MMIDATGKPVSRTTLKVGQTCSLSDGRHGTMRYTFRGRRADRLEFTVTSIFDARSFGDGVTRQTKRVTVAEYSQEDAPHQP